MKIPRDKLLHLAAGALAALVGVFIGYQAGDVAPIVVGAGACVAAAVAREIYNHSNGGEFDRRDLAATLIGGVPVLLLAAVVL